jgi:hypothetical protein
MRYCAILFILIYHILLPGGANGEIYKWVDEGGTPHFSDTPPPCSEVTYETLRQVTPSSQKVSAGHPKEVHLPSSDSRLYSGKPLYFWRDQLAMLNSKIAMKQGDIRLLKSAIDETDMYQPQKKNGMIIYPRKLRVDGRDGYVPASEKERHDHLSEETQGRWKAFEYERPIHRGTGSAVRTTQGIRGGTPGIEEKGGAGRGSPMGLGGLIPCWDFKERGSRHDRPM